MQKQQILKQAAQYLLDESGLIENLSQVGQVNITGSFKYDLMVEPDIDIEVFCLDPHSSSIDFAKKQIENDHWNGIMYFDWTKWRRDHFPEGYYVGFKHDFEGFRWKVDIWFLKENYQVRNADNLIINATESHRNLILEAKEARLKEGWTVDSTAIYKAVIENNLTQLDQVRAILIHTSKHQSG